MSKLKISNRKLIEVSDWDKLVEETYGKPYSFQQQDGCKDRGIINITISKEEVDDTYPDEIPFEINGEEMGVSFKTWLNTTKEDINNKNPESYPGQNILFWERNFYPDLYVVANDMCKKGLIEAGDYSININW